MTKLIVPVIVLVFLNILAHFIPFEHASLGNDDYALSLKARGMTVSDIIRDFPKQPDRPLAFLVLMLQEKILEKQPYLSIYFILFSSTIVLLAVFVFFRVLFQDIFLALVASVCFCLLPNKLEVYHIPIYIFMDMAHFLYILSFLSFVYFVKVQIKPLLMLSFFSYFAALFFYETGFFLPCCLLIYTLLYNRKLLKSATYYLIPLVFYAVFKFTKAFWLATGEPIHSHSPSLSLLHTNFIDLFHQYLGRYMVRNVFYGFYKFLDIEKPWLVINVALNIAVCLILLFYIEKKEIKKIDKRALIVACVIFFFFICPVLVNRAGGIGGRHLVLPSLGISIIVLWLLAKAKTKWRVFFALYCACMLVVCEGNAWTQVVACRINGAVYETLKEKKQELLKAENIIIDTRSFADAIPFTLVKRDFNVLNTYYGAQAFEDWGLTSMTRLVLGGIEKPIYIATESPRFIKSGFFEFAVSENRGYRSVSKKIMIVPMQNALVIDFNSVYGAGFNNGLRKK